MHYNLSTRKTEARQLHRKAGCNHARTHAGILSVLTPDRSSLPPSCGCLHIKLNHAFWTAEIVVLVPDQNIPARGDAARIGYMAETPDVQSMHVSNEHEHS
uniref:Amino acid adenylation n=1 Tax=Ascaris lumbricoides TaxID=6252 RepID=A0A0M3I178_ASCLU